MFFFFNAAATTALSTLSLHDALPICRFPPPFGSFHPSQSFEPGDCSCRPDRYCRLHRSEEHTSELQSRRDLVCRLLLEKKKKCMRGNFLRTLCIISRYTDRRRTDTDC